MANKRKSMRKVREVLRLALRGRSESATDCPQSVALADHGRGVSTPRPERRAHLAATRSLDDAQLEARLYPVVAQGKADQRPMPDWSEVHQELKRKGVTLLLLWQEHKTTHPDGLQYSQFCDRYRFFAGKLDLVMRQHHRAGEKLFVDYAGQTVEVVDRDTGEIRVAQIFVATLGASNYTYAEATWTQGLPDWCASHIRTFEFMGAVAELLVPDNLKSAVTRPCRYEPQANATYEDLAAHYRTAILPARVRRPRDKAKVEQSVLLVERWILARLRHQTFFSLGELNAAIRDLIEPLNEQPVQEAVRLPTDLVRATRPPGHEAPARQSATPMPNGSRHSCTSTTTSRSRGITTPSPTNW